MCTVRLMWDSIFITNSFFSRILFFDSLHMVSKLHHSWVPLFVIFRFFILFLSLLPFLDSSFLFFNRCSLSSLCFLINDSLVFDFAYSLPVEASLIESCVRSARRWLLLNLIRRILLYHFDDGSLRQSILSSQLRSCWFTTGYWSTHIWCKFSFLGAFCSDGSQRSQ